MKSVLLLCVHSCNNINEEKETSLIWDPFLSSLVCIIICSWKRFCSVLIKASIASWLWGWYGDHKICLKFIQIKYVSKILLTNSFLVSDWRISGYSCIKTWAITFLTVIASLFLIWITQAYFEKRFTQISK